MDTLVESVLIFSCFIFWMTLFFRKRSFRKLKRLEESLRDKVFVLEGLTDKIQSQLQGLSSLRSSQGSSSSRKLYGEEPPASSQVSMSPVIERTLPLNFQFQGHKDKYSEDFVEQDKNRSRGVKGMVKQAKENMEKIDVSNVVEVKSFKDVVLLSKKIERKQV